MSRWLFLLLVSMFVAILLVPGCNDEGGVGDPCRPEVEYSASFNDFDPDNFWTESNSYQCRTRLCLVNHFRGRVSCPYGQTADGTPWRTGGTSCVVPGTSDQKVTGGGFTPDRGAEVRPQCANRTTDQAVYCSCRCANVDGRTDDGANYCSCPDGFSCEQLGFAIPGQDSQLSGAFCIKSGTRLAERPCGLACDPAERPCP